VGGYSLPPLVQKEGGDRTLSGSSLREQERKREEQAER